MIKISLCILTVYLMYYAGNILYDLFLKNEKESYKEGVEEFSFSEISEQYEHLPKIVGIEDVENLNTPQSFNKNIIHSDSIEAKQEMQDLKHLREQFESEQDIDHFQYDQEISEDQSNISDIPPRDNDEDSSNQNTDESSLNVSKTNNDKFRNLLNLAETNVQLIANNNGYKTYQSTM
ncbi:hypothetical protein LPB85_12740 [Chryseobacterium sp. LC2016-27]|uniref:hypothetical protein n=1 Tax=Chryseobacterium sp. LC2016-27 TaxID=2897326 RepID=UPI001E3BD2C4|nr:hypothetical protein [Chryseobacterium sp. LC2016-27]MCD0456304.1 hypothetical protein [Chryseobacterium sp. LC2016-27]